VATTLEFLNLEKVFLECYIISKVIKASLRKLMKKEELKYQRL